MGFCARSKLAEFARELRPMGITGVETRNVGDRVVVVVNYGARGVATVDVTKLDRLETEKAVSDLKNSSET